MITNDTLMRDATYREWVAAKIYAEDVDMCVEGAVNETDKLIARLNETAAKAEAAPEPAAEAGIQLRFKGRAKSHGLVGACRWWPHAMIVDEGFSARGKSYYDRETADAELPLLKRLAEQYAANLFATIEWEASNE